MKRSQVLLAALLLAPPSFEGPSAQQTTTILPILLLNRSSVPAARQGMAGSALRDIAARVREAHAEFWTMSAYLPAFYEGEVTVHVFGAAKDSATLQQAFLRYDADDVWQRRLTAYNELISADLANEILIPVAGRALPEPGPVRAWRSVSVRADAFADALIRAKKLVDHVNTSHPTVALSLYHQEMGTFGTLHFFEDHAELASWVDLHAELLRDSAFLALQDELNALLVEGSIQTELLQSYAL